MEKQDGLTWHAKWSVEKFSAEDIAAAGLDPSVAERDDIVKAGVEPYEQIDREGNLLMYGGASLLWEVLEGNGTTTAAQTLTYIDDTNGYIGVGASATAAAATQTDLLTTPTRKVFDGTYPQHTDGDSLSSHADVVYKATFATGDANIAWNEWGIFNASTGGRMLNRKVESLGTKTSAASWAFTVTLSLS